MWIFKEFEIVCSLKLMHGLKILEDENYLKQVELLKIS